MSIEQQKDRLSPSGNSKRLFADFEKAIVARPPRSRDYGNERA